MEKIHALITKLQELKESHASLSTFSYYTQLLYAEIMRVKSENREQHQHTKISVSVILPAGLREDGDFDPITPIPEISVSSSGKISQHAEPIPAGKKEMVQEYVFAPPTEKPQVQQSTPLTFTPSHQGRTPGSENRERKEINEMNLPVHPSRNEQLGHTQQEVAEKLSTALIKELQDAITLNDKFVFINDLFRGDRDMYDRSVKTINSFTSMREAEYWIERELKIKMGWREEHELVKNFYGVVRKRFPAI
ncbi:MAG TPA: hypothetical protein VNE41_02685 [Chitinophagaceae bacterium]|nr:hypothetical protein [Chitinophagaceae bacterium]